MAIADAHRWQALELTQRQRLITEFYAKNQPDRAHQFLSMVRAPKGYGVFASIGPNYQYAVFGRDSITIAQDLLTTNHALAKEIILLLAGFQGTKFDLVSEEEPGKIHHEYRAMHFNHREVPKAAQIVFNRLTAQWGGNSERLLYYGSFDSTPLFIRLVYKYCQQYGSDILDHQVISAEGVKNPLHAHVRMATAWLVNKVTASPWQLFEYKRLNLAGLYNQSWEDSSVSYLHTDGAVANADDGIAAIELQGYCYDALRAAAELVAINEQEANTLRHLASIVRDNALERMWMVDKRYFAMGLDRDDSGETRHIATLSNNPGLLLESDFLSLMPHHLAWPYIEGIVRALFSEEFVTNAGLRLRGRNHVNLVSFADYHGSLVSWPKQNFAIARGLRKHRFYKLANLLEDCSLQAIARAGEFYEFFFVDVEGRVKYHYRQENPDEPTFHDFGAANLPDPGQAWTISSVLRIVNARQAPEPALPVIDPVRKLETHILSQKHIIEVVELCEQTLNK